MPANDFSHLAEPWADPEVVHARKEPGVPALCGAPGNSGTQKRRWVTCEACLKEVDQRMAERKRAKVGE